MSDEPFDRAKRAQPGHLTPIQEDTDMLNETQDAQTLWTPARPAFWVRTEYEVVDNRTNAVVHRSGTMPGAERVRDERNAEVVAAPPTIDDVMALAHCYGMRLRERPIDEAHPRYAAVMEEIDDAYAELKTAVLAFLWTGTGSGGGDGKRPIAEALAEAIGQPVVGAVWAIGMAMDGVYFVSERWENGGGWTSHHATLTACLADLASRVDSPTATDASVASVVPRDALGRWQDAVNAIMEADVRPVTWTMSMDQYNAVAGWLQASEPPPTTRAIDPGLVLDREAEMALRRLHGFMLGVVADAVTHGFRLEVERRDLDVLGAVLHPSQETPDDHA